MKSRFKSGFFVLCQSQTIAEDAILGLTIAVVFR